MKQPWYASGARQLLETRQRGQAPAGPVVVSLVGGTFNEVAETTLYVNADMPAERLEWRMLVNLEVWLWAGPSIELAKVMFLADRIAQVRPRRLVLRFDHPFSFTWNDGKRDVHETIDTHDIDVGSGYHHKAADQFSAEHSFYWCPTPCNGTPLECQLRRALAATHKPGTWL